MAGRAKPGSQNITLNELLTELDNLRAARKSFREFSPEVDKIILHGRKAENPMGWKMLSRFLKEKGLGNYGHTSLATRYKKLSNGGK